MSRDIVERGTNLLIYLVLHTKQMYADQLIDLMTVGQIAPIMKFGDFIMN